VQSSPSYKIYIIYFFIPSSGWKKIAVRLLGSCIRYRLFNMIYLRANVDLCISSEGSISQNYNNNIN